MRLRTCAADDCTERFSPFSIDHIYHSKKCGTRMRVKHKRQRDRLGGSPPDGGGPRQPMLFSKSAYAKAKPPKPTPVIERTLFEEGLLASKKAAGRVSHEIAAGASA